MRLLQAARSHRQWRVELPTVWRKCYICAIKDIITENDKSDEQSKLIRHLGTLLLRFVIFSINVTISLCAARGGWRSSTLQECPFWGWRSSKKCPSMGWRSSRVAHPGGVTILQSLQTSIGGDVPSRIPGDEISSCNKNKIVGRMFDVKPLTVSFSFL